MKIRADIIYANREKRAPWGVPARADAIHIPVLTSVLFDVLFVYF